MNILIVGAGVVGANLAEELSVAGHNVSIVDRDPALVRRISEKMDVLAISGNAGQPSVLRKAGIDDAEIVIAVTNIDEVNLVICMLARTFGVKHKIARVRNETMWRSSATARCCWSASRSTRRHPSPANAWPSCARRPKWPRSWWWRSSAAIPR
jgi:heterodisulfide reductase subunit A-like polyferredoxin